MSILTLHAIARPDIWLAAPPFLPPGRGGLILITGGLSMLVFALFLLSISRHPLPGGVTQAHAARDQPVQQARRTRQARVAAAHQGPMDPPRPHKAVLATAMHASSGVGTLQSRQLQWPEFVQRAAAAEGLGRPHVLEVQGTRATLLVEHCASCRRRKGNCKRERRALQRAARRLSRHAEVREVSCNIDRRHACAFELRMRGRT